MDVTPATIQSNLPEDYLPFLDYPHAHDTTSVSDIAAFSTDMLRQLPEEVQDSLWQLQESTSVVYASYTRLQDLVAQKFDRLSLVPGSDSYSEVILFNYVNQCTAERRYFFDDALPEWKHKLRDIRLDGYLELTFMFKKNKITMREWLANLQDRVTNWAQEARSLRVPDFDDTVSEYTFVSTTPATSASSSSTSLSGNLSRPPSMSQPANDHAKDMSSPGSDVEERHGPNSGSHSVFEV